jgi:hypothetical protein
MGGVRLAELGVGVGMGMAQRGLEVLNWGLLRLLEFGIRRAGGVTRMVKRAKGYPVIRRMSRHPRIRVRSRGSCDDTITWPIRVWYLI